MRGPRIAKAALIAVMMSALGACSSLDSWVVGGAGDSGGGSGAPAPAGGGQGSGQGGGFADRIGSLFSGPSETASVNAPQDDWTCPRVDIRQGASTLAVNTPGEPSATSLRYQATIGRTARECAKFGAAMTIKVGVQGRLLLGPMGEAGDFEIPLRYAVVQEGPSPKTVWTKLHRVPVSVGADQTNVPFIHVEEDVSFPTPTDAELESYVVYVGFDQLGAREQPQRRRKKRGGS